MKQIEFKEQTKILQRPNTMTAEECGPLPIFSDGKHCVSCWQPTWREKLSILFYGRVWLSVLSGNTQSPVSLRGYKTAFERK